MDGRPNFVALAKIMALLGSDQPGERTAALSKVDDWLRSAALLRRSHNHGLGKAGAVCRARAAA
jgi:hypothetical protein